MHLTKNVLKLLLTKSWMHTRLLTPINRPYTDTRKVFHLRAYCSYCSVQRNIKIVYGAHHGCSEKSVVEKKRKNSTASTWCKSWCSICRILHMRVWYFVNKASYAVGTLQTNEMICWILFILVLITSPVLSYHWIVEFLILTDPHVLIHFP